MHLIAGAHGRPLNPSGLFQLFLIQFAVDTPVEQRFVAEVLLFCRNCSQFSQFSSAIVCRETALTRRSGTGERG